MTSAPPTVGRPRSGESEIRFFGEPVFAVIARSYQEARKTARLGQVDVNPGKPVLTVDQALASGSFVSEQKQLQRGDWQAGLEQSPRRITGPDRDRQPGPLLS
ncbi:MAG: hypothetical protein CM1200mP20_15780 [Pseudomonadota bacterium]|nr:MAG: hypothetical protein CM1200mP20_15780 [Pseudomonadota bacterium]